MCLLILVSACGKPPEEAPPSGRAARATDVFNLRNLARLHGGRDTQEGYAEAIAVCEHIVAAVEDDADDWMNLARAHLLHGIAPGDAAEPLRRARLLVRSAPPELDYLDGLLAKFTDDDGSAFAAFRRVVEKLPEHPEALFQCGLAAEGAGEADEAERCYRKLVAGGPLVVPAAYRLSLVLSRSRPEEGAAMLALFEERRTAVNPETVKCDLTTIRIRPSSPEDNEPPVCPLVWNEEVIANVSGARGVRAACVSMDGTVVLARAEDVLWIVRGKQRVVAGGASHVALGDLDNDGAAELVLVREDGLYLAGDEGAKLICATDSDLVDIATFDCDHDGDLDVLALTETGAFVARNDGDGTFTALEAFVDAPAAPPAGRMDAHDVDQANDLDVVTPTADGDPVLWLNLRADGYRAVPIEDVGARPIIRLFDLDSDGAPDVFATGGSPGFVVRRNSDPDGRPYAVRFDEPQRAGDAIAHDAVPADVDNDGDLDVLLAADGGLILLRNHAGTLRQEAAVALSGGKGARRVACADLDGDGILEAVVIDVTGRVHVLDPGGVGGHESVLLIPRGKKDNADAVGAVLEVFAGRRYQNRLIRSGGGVHVGVGPGGRAAFDGYALRWPQGIRQSVPREGDGPLPRRIEVDQKEGLVASCPFLYTLSPDGWRFVTDVIGIAPLGEWVPEGTVPHLDPEEWVRIPGDALEITDGRVRLAVTEELRETAYLDQVLLSWIDHDPAAEIVADESTRQGAYDPLRPLRLIGAATMARVTVRSTDVTDSVRERDGQYLHGYVDARSQWGGWVPRHEIELVTAEPARWLVLEGRIAWYDSTTVFSLAQHGRSWGPTRLLRHGDDGLETVIDDLGVPAGMDRAMVVDCGHELPAGTKLVLSGQHRFLWDRIRTVARVDPVDVGVAGEGRGRPAMWSLPSRARLFEHGFSRVVGDAARHEQRYDWSGAAPDDSYPRARGMATRHGDVLQLVTAHDDRSCVLVPGDACELDFAVPPIPDGRRRTWFLRVTGWAKEGGYHNGRGATIEPMPLRGSGVYPPASPRDDAGWRRYEEIFQTRLIR